MADAVEHSTTGVGRGGRGSDRLTSRAYRVAWLLLLGSIIPVVMLLVMPLRAPIGPMYWDTFTYYDAANRILSGQMPVRDFFTPAGPLGYAIAAFWVWAFPNGQPTLLLHWSTLTVSLPLMALVLAGLPQEERPLAIWLVLPFLLFSLLSFNGKEYSSFPGSDGFAYYNRQTCLVLFPLVAGLVFVRHRLMLTALIITSMLALFFLKITGFVAAGLICLFAFAAGRLRLKDAVMAALGFAVALAMIELPTRLVSGYVTDILLLLGMNSGTLLPRVFQALSINFGLVASLSLLILVLMWADRSVIRASLGQFAAQKSSATVGAILDRPVFWLVTLTLAGVAFETQNTASQAMIFVWPVLLWIARDFWSAGKLNQTAITVLALVGAIYLPPVVNIAERTARAYIGTVGNVALVHKNLGTLGNVSARPQVVERARTMAALYAAHRATYENVARRGEMPSALLYSDFDFQIMHLMSIDSAIEAIRTLEAQKGLRFETLMTLDFANPFPWLMGRRAPLSITVGSDPFRAVPPLNMASQKAVGAVDLALLPTCPPTPAVAKLAQHFAQPLAQHRRVQLTQCYDVYLHPKFN